LILFEEPFLVGGECGDEGVDRSGSDGARVYRAVFAHRSLDGWFHQVHGIADEGRDCVFVVAPGNDKVVAGSMREVDELVLEVDLPVATWMVVFFGIHDLSLIVGGVVRLGNGFGGSRGGRGRVRGGMQVSRG